MSKKKKIIISIIVIVLIIIISLLILLIGKIKNDKQISNENIEIITINYEKLSKNIDDFNQIRNEYVELSSEFFYETYLEEEKKYLDILSRYKDNINKITLNINNIDDKCYMLYDDLSINKKCNTYKIIYEKLINLYIRDVKDYNNKIDGYNNYKNSNINFFEIEYKDYIDYNNDNRYEGIDNNEEN